MEMPGRRTGTADRYGFNGKEKDRDINSLTAYDYGFRIYNPGIGRFLSVDPLTQKFAWYTPYQFAGNKSIIAIDLDGLEEYLVNNYLDHWGRLSETVIVLLNKKNVGPENMFLVDRANHYLAHNRVLIRDVKTNGQTNYTHTSALSPEQQLIVQDQKKYFFDPHITPFAIEGGNGIGNDNGDFYQTMRADYSSDVYSTDYYFKKYTYLPDDIQFDKSSLILYLNQESDLMYVPGKGNVKNGSIAEMSQKLKDLPKNILKDPTVKAVVGTLVWDVGTGLSDAELKTVQKALKQTGSEIEAFLKKNGIKNVKVITSVNPTSKINNKNALTFKLKH